MRYDDDQHTTDEAWHKTCDLVLMGCRDLFRSWGIEGRLLVSYSGDVLSLSNIIIHEYRLAVYDLTNCNIFPSA